MVLKSWGISEANITRQKSKSTELDENKSKEENNLTNKSNNIIQNSNGINNSNLVQSIKNTQILQNNSEPNKEVLKPNTINFSLNNKAPNAAFDMSNKEGCSPLVVKFIPDEKSDTAIYQWNFGNGFISNEKSPEFTYNDAGTFNVTLIVQYPKSKTSSNRTWPVIIKSPPTADFSWISDENNND